MRFKLRARHLLRNVDPISAVRITVLSFSCDRSLPPLTSGFTKIFPLITRCSEMPLQLSIVVSGQSLTAFRKPDWSCPVDKKLAAEKIRARLEKRLATFLGCELRELPRMKLGTLVHTLFLLLGDSEELGGFHTSMDGVLQLVGREMVWDIELKAEEAETPKVVIN